MNDPDCFMCGPQRPVKILQGGHKTFTVSLFDSTSRGPLDLTTATAISTCFQNADLTELMLALGTGISIVSPPVLGKIQIDLTAAQTTLLAVVLLGTLELKISFSGGDPIKIAIPQAYLVQATVC